MNRLSELEAFINEHNLNIDEDFAIDSIRIEFQKQYKMEKLQEVGKWHKINAKDKKIMAKLKNRLTTDEVTTAFQLEKENIYYYNSSTPPKYRQATLVIFGMKQYHKEAPKRELIFKLLSILKNVSNIDICIDLPYKPNIEALKKHFDVERYFTKERV